MKEQEFAELLARGYEQRGVEFKGQGSRDEKGFLAKVVRAILGMANRRDGGLVILGVADEHGALRPVGLTQEQLDSWRYDNLSAALAEYADPSISFDLEVITHQHARFVVIGVDEFEEVPILCKKEYTSILRRGACYVRSRRMPETAEVASHEEMRELLSLAIDKGVRQYLARAYRLGLLPAPPGTSPPTAEKRFDEQLGELE